MKGNLKYISSVAVMLFSVLFCNASSKKFSEANGKKTNIVFIIADDLGYSDVSYMGEKPEINTPNIDKLAKSGITFMDAYAAAPVCSPTRASIMTGKYPATVKLTCHIPGIGMKKYIEKLSKGKKLKEAYFRDHLPLNEITFAEILQKQGYATGYFGKWHLGGEGSIYTKDGIINPKYDPDNFGYDVNIGGCSYGQPASYFSPYKNGTIKDGPDGEYLTDRLGDEAVKFIEQKKDQPFFLNLATYTVHTPLKAPEEYVKKYHGNKYFAMIEKLDENVGKVMNKLEELNLLENTLVVFYSDNGGLWGNPPLKGKKGTLNEGGLRVPMIISYKNKIKPGRICKEPVTSVDFFPTFIEIAGLSPSNYPQLEGVSLIPIMEGKDKLPKRAIYWHFPHHRKEGLSMGAAIRQGDWKLIEEFETGNIYLYNLKNDLGETENLKGKFPKISNRLIKKLKTWQKKVDAEMPSENNTY